MTTLTYWPVGMPVTMTWVGGTRHGTIIQERVPAGLPNVYDYQRVRWADDGTEDNVAPQVLSPRSIQP